VSERIVDILEEFRERAQWASAPTLDGLIARWSTFVQEVESGYSLTIYDYTNDLATRDLLEDILGRVCEQESGEVASLLAPWDERFKFATASLDGSLPGADAFHGWWWRRLPRKVTGELEVDLKGAGLL
jgi:hypothetical protein